MQKKLKTNNFNSFEIQFSKSQIDFYTKKTDRDLRNKKIRIWLYENMRKSSSILRKSQTIAGESRKDFR